MSGETEQQISGWTTDTLHSHMQRQIDDIRTLLDERYQTQTKALDAAFSAAEKAVQTALASAEKAVNKAELAADKRFEAVNEFRAQLSDQASTFLPRSEADVRISALADQVDHIAARMDKSEGKSVGTSSLLGWGIAALTVVILVANFITSR